MKNLTPQGNLLVLSRGGAHFMFWKIKNFIRKLYFFYYKKKKIYTVVLRGKLNEEDKKIFSESKNLLSLENYKSWKSENLKQKIYLEIGFGNGHCLVNSTERFKGDKDIFLIGVELYKQGVVKVLREIENKNLENLKVICVDGRDFLEENIKNIEKWKQDGNFGVAKISVLFPDPWPKKSKHKKRLVNENFIKLCLQNIKTDGSVTIATDWQDYADSIENILEKIKLENLLNFKKIIESQDLINSLEYKDIFTSTFARRAKKEGRATTIFEIYHK